jgi:hypothetical protein
MEETIVRGRYPSGPEYVDVQHLHGSAQAKQRLRVILETMMGQWRVGEACARLGICGQRFRQLPPSFRSFGRHIICNPSSNMSPLSRLRFALSVFRVLCLRNGARRSGGRVFHAAA